MPDFFLCASLLPCRGRNGGMACACLFRRRCQSAPIVPMVGRINRTALCQLGQTRTDVPACNRTTRLSVQQSREAPCRGCGACRMFTRGSDRGTGGACVTGTVAFGVHSAAPRNDKHKRKGDTMRAADDGTPAGPPIIGSILLTIRRPENRILLIAGTVMFLGAGSVFISVFVAHGQLSTWLSVVGGTLFATGISVFLSVLAARQTATEGYAKEANVGLKDRLYVPLYDELKKLADELKGAQEAQRPYPQVIDDGHRSGYDSRGNIVVLNYTPLTLSLWPAVRTTRQIEHFSAEARQLLGATLDHARTYNDAVEAMRPPARKLLARVLQEAIEKVEKAQEYQEWYRDEQKRYEQQYPGQNVFPSGLNSQPPPPDEQHQLFAALAYGLSYAVVGHPLHEVWAGAWLNALPIHQPMTMGWILARRPDKAAQVVYQSNISTNRGATASIHWYEELFTTVTHELRTGDEFQQFTNQAHTLAKSLNAALQRLDKGMQIIRDRYEGGAPLV